MSTIRTFVAVEIAPRVRDRACRLVEQLRTSDPNVKWVQPENMHLTLNFLGDVDERSIPEACQAVAQAADSVAPFRMQCSGTGAFPNTNHPRTLWIGVEQGQAEICQLQEATANALAQLGYPKEHRRYHPHLTLGRIRRGSAGSGLSELLLENEAFDAGATDVEQVVVFSSRLEPSGPVYEALARVPLANDCNSFQEQVR